MLLIENWIKGSQNFIVGKVLYNHFGNNNSLVQLLQQGETPLAKDTLLKALTELAHKGPAKTQQPETAPFTQMPTGTDNILTAIQNEWNPLYQEMNMLRHKLDHYGNDNSHTAREYRKELAEKILFLEQRIIAIWSKRDYYLQHGKLLETKSEEFTIPTEPHELAALIERLKRYIRKHRKNLKDNPASTTYAALLNKYESQLNQINAKHDAT